LIRMMRCLGEDEELLAVGRFSLAVGRKDGREKVGGITIHDYD